jgi:hypothetical protein
MWQPSHQKGKPQLNFYIQAITHPIGSFSWVTQYGLRLFSGFKSPEKTYFTFKEINE